jgi:Family of unknown function (DUF6082)
VLRTVGRRRLTWSLVPLVIAGVVAAVIASPLALRGVRGATAEWSRLSLIGQTYGAASALLSAFALVGVAASIMLQARESRANRAQLRRTFNLALMGRAMDDPVYAAVWSFTGMGDDAAQRQHMYVNQIVSFWEMLYELKAISEPELRIVAAGVLSSAPGHRYWQRASEPRLTVADTRRGRRFHAILTEEFHRATPPASLNLDSREVTNRRPRIRPAERILLPLAGAALASAIFHIARRSHRRDG